MLQTFHGHRADVMSVDLAPGPNPNTFVSGVSKGTSHIDIVNFATIMSSCGYFLLTLPSRRDCENALKWHNSTTYWASQQLVGRAFVYLLYNAAILLVH